MDHFTKNYLLVDMHAHSSGISHCCRISYKDVIHSALNTQIDGIILTNHYQKSYVTDGDYYAFAVKYVEEFHLAKQYGDSVGCKVFFGIEVTMDKHDNAHLLIYGVDESFILNNPTVFDLTQKELYTLVKSVGGVLIQAHPYRTTKNLLDVKFLDGVEVNCHPLYKKSDFLDMNEIAKNNGILLTCGGDFHADTYRPKCGAYLPNTITSGVDVGKYLATINSIKLCIQEPYQNDWFDFLYKK